MITIGNILEVEKYLNDIEGVVFDLDDTLYSEKDYVRSGYRKIAEHFKLPCLVEQMWEVFLRGGKAIDEVLRQNEMLHCQGEALTIYREQMPDINLYPGTEEMLKRIHKSKKIGIITDGRPNGQWNKIRALGLKSMVDEIIVTDELGGLQFRKPNDISFRIMQKRWGIPYEQIVYVGDNFQKDFQAPKQLGMRWIYFRNEDGLYSHCDVSYKNMIKDIEKVRV